MKLAAIVPLNSHDQSKTRLASALDSAGRAALSRWLAQHVLETLHAARIANVAVVSPDDDVLRWASRSGAWPIRQADSGLNEALALGRDWAVRRSVDALLVALGDLPLFTADDALALIAAAEGAADMPSVTIAPDRAGRGTNVLLLRPPAALPFAFGEDSLARHIELAQARGIAPQIVHLLGAAFDVDTPADLEELIARGLWRPSGARPQLWTGEAS